MLSGNAGEMVESVTFIRKLRTKRPDAGYDTGNDKAVFSDCTYFSDGARFADAFIGASACDNSGAIGSAFVSLRPMRGGEREEAGRLVGALSYSILIYRDDLPDGLTTDDVVLWESARGDIELNLRVIERPRGRDLVARLVCERNVQP